MQFRILTSEDVPAAVELIVACYGESWRETAVEEFEIAFSDDYYRPDFYGFFEGQEMTALGATMRTGFMVNLRSISWVCVAPSRQKQGIGGRFVSELLARIADDYFEGKEGSVVLTAKEEVCEVYMKLGFTKGPSVHDGDFIMTKRMGVA